jgi:phenylacetate-coenzyme A ligase PaaK-like adenylate-forming protein
MKDIVRVHASSGTTGKPDNRRVSQKATLTCGRNLWRVPCIVPEPTKTASFRLLTVTDYSRAGLACIYGVEKWGGPLYRFRRKHTKQLMLMEDSVPHSLPAHRPMQCTWEKHWRPAEKTFGFSFKIRYLRRRTVE